MNTSNIFYILIGCMLITFSTEAYERKISSCSEPSRAKDGEHGIPGYLEDGENGRNGKNGGYGGQVQAFTVMEEMLIKIN